VTRIAPKRNKYGARKVQFQGITFDSKAERDYYLLLLAKQQAGEISGFRRQPQYVLQEAFRNAEGKHRAAITYTADFEVTYPDGRVEVVDVKGYVTKDFSIRQRLFERRYGIALKVIKPEDIPKMR
jgi:hypothetical protein